MGGLGDDAMGDDFEDSDDEGSGVFIFLFIFKC